MPTTLTNAGWNGEWTNGNDTIASTNGIVIDAGTIVNTLAGKDSITGTGGLDTSKAALTSLAPLNFGIANLGQIITGKNTDSLTGIATGIDPGYFVFGIYNEGSISLGNGSGSSIKGRAIGDGYSLGSTGVFSIAGIYNRSGTIAIGNGNNNSILGIGKATGIGLYSEGIFNRQGGVISIGNGNKNSITGIGGFYNGIYNRGLITMGNGNNNSITGIGTSTDFPSFTETTGAYGIYNQNVGTNPTIAIGNGDNTSIKGIAKGWNSVGIYNETGGTITIGNGNKVSIAGKATGSGTVGIQNETGGTIAMGNGTGTITGEALGFFSSIGINNNGTIDAGDGNDSIKGTGGGPYGGLGIHNGGTLDAGSGNDIITGKGFTGIENLSTGTIDMGDGNDFITGTGRQSGSSLSSGFGISNDGTLDAGSGNDFILGKSTGTGLNNVGTIDMGSGNDSITGISSTTDPYPSCVGLSNVGTIDMGSGNDKLFSSSILNGVSQNVTLDGGGEIHMGSGDDLLKGFGNMHVYGDDGSGNLGTDTLNFGSLKLSDFSSITKIGAGSNFAEFVYNGITMTTNEFDKFIFAGQVVNYSGLG